jgi:hypothetical protein
MKNETPTAFPWTYDNITCTGMSLRDYFAAKAMQGMFASDTSKWNEEGDWPSRAEAAFMMADAMLRAREA